MTQEKDTEVPIGMCSVKVYGNGPTHCGKPMTIAMTSEHFVCECGARIAMSQMVYTNATLMKRDEVTHG